MRAITVVSLPSPGLMELMGLGPLCWQANGSLATRYSISSSKSLIVQKIQDEPRMYTCRIELGMFMTSLPSRWSIPRSTPQSSPWQRYLVMTSLSWLTLFHRYEDSL